MASDRTCGEIADGTNGVSAAGGAMKQAVCRLKVRFASQVGIDIFPCWYGSWAFVIFQCPLLFGGIDYPKIIEAGIHGRNGTYGFSVKGGVEQNDAKIEATTAQKVTNI